MDSLKLFLRRDFNQFPPRNFFSFVVISLSREKNFQVNPPREQPKKKLKTQRGKKSSREITWRMFHFWRLNRDWLRCCDSVLQLEQLAWRPMTKHSRRSTLLMKHYSMPAKHRTWASTMLWLTSSVCFHWWTRCRRHRSRWAQHCATWLMTLYYCFSSRLAVYFRRFWAVWMLRRSELLAELWAGISMSPRSALPSLPKKTREKQKPLRLGATGKALGTSTHDCVSLPSRQLPENCLIISAIQPLTPSGDG